MDQEKITDRNVAQLDFAHKKLEERLMPGSRMMSSRPGASVTYQPGQTSDLIQQIVDNENQLRAELVDARTAIESFERDYTKLESEHASLRAMYDGEKARREHYEDMLREIARLVVNGAKDKPNV